MFASISYLESHHAYTPIPGQPAADDIPKPNAPANETQTTTQSTQPSTQQPEEPAKVGVPGDPVPDPPGVFRARLTELAKDLVLKEQQIEELIKVLPGIDQSVEEQERRIRELGIELEKAEKDRVQALEEREKLLEKVESVIVGVRRV